MAAIREQGHGERLSDSAVRAHPVSVTMPPQAVTRREPPVVATVVPVTTFVAAANKQGMIGPRD
jgi:hypothetical protein